MKRMLDARFRRSEAGMALVLVTIVMALGMLVIPPLLNFMGGAGRSAQIRENRMLETYAADAGIEQAYLRILGGGGPGQFAIENLNGYAVDVEITKDGGTYKAVSSSSGYEGPGSVIESNFGAVGYNDFLDYVISSEGKVSIGAGSVVVGNITSNYPPKVLGEHIGNTTTNVPAWPEPGELTEYYEDVTEGYGVCWTTGSVTVHADDWFYVGPCYTTGSLNFSGFPGGNVTLDGTIHVAGDFSFGQGLQLFLNGHTLYAEGSILFQPGSMVYGPGCVIAEGDVDFQPQQQGEDFIFVMSVAGRVKMRPNGDFWGSIAGIAQVDLQPGCSMRWKPYPDDDQDGISDLDFPGGGIASAKVMSYVIRR